MIASAVVQTKRGTSHAAQPRQATSTGLVMKQRRPATPRPLSENVHFPSSSDHQGDRKTLHLAMSLGINIGSEPGSASILFALYR
jgi:hypothetical protein